MVCNLLPPKTKKRLLLILAASRLTTEVKMCKIFKNQTDDNGKMLQVNICIKTFSGNGDFNQKYKSWLIIATIFKSQHYTPNIFTNRFFDSDFDVKLRIINSFLQHLNFSFSNSNRWKTCAPTIFSIYIFIKLSRQEGSDSFIGVLHSR